MRSAFRAANHSILIIGWDIDSRTPLCGDSFDPDDGWPLTLRDFLVAAVKAKPHLRIKLLLWDYSILYALEREPLPRVKLDWLAEDQIALELDDTVPFGASHHQKIVVVDDCLAFSGGLDLTIRRWDTPGHLRENAHRRDPAGKPYPPFHDVQILVDGTAAKVLGELARERWRQATGERLAVPNPPRLCWPENVRVDLQDVELGISRTVPDGVREVEILFQDMIVAARRSIYIETQFLTARRVCEALITALGDNSELEIVIVSPKTLHTWLEQQTMIAGRYHFMEKIKTAGFGDRVRLVYPEVRADDGTTSEVMIHSKVMVIDDTLLRVGSANINNRSMGTDTECDITIEAHDDASRAGITQVRNRLLAEHLGLTIDEVARRTEGHGTLHALLDAGADCRCLCPIVDERPADTTPALEAVADPPEPIANASAETLRHAWARPRTWLLATAVILGLSVIGAVWQVDSLRELAKPETVTKAFAGFKAHPAAPLFAVGAFVVGGLISFPLNILIVVTAAVFGSWLGLLYAATGGMTSALVGYALGRVFGTRIIRRVSDKYVRKFKRLLRQQGIISVTAIRMVPFLPFIVVNVLAGALKVRLLDYTLGTLAGLLPGLLVLSFAGDRAMAFVQSPTLKEGLLLVLAVALWLGVTFALQRFMARGRTDG